MRIELPLLRAVACARSTDPEVSRASLSGVLVWSVPGRVVLVASDGVVLFFGQHAGAPDNLLGSWVLAPETLETLLNDPSPEVLVDWEAGVAATWQAMGLPVKTIGAPFPEWRRVVPETFWDGEGASDGCAFVNMAFVSKFIQAAGFLYDGNPGAVLRPLGEDKSVICIPGVPNFGGVISGLRREIVGEPSIPRTT